MNHIAFYSSGAASWLAAMRVAQKYGTENLYLVFADTGVEDQDNYRFLEESALVVGGKLIRLKDGRTPWDVYFENKWLSHRQGEKGCSFLLKIKPCQEWIKSMQFDPSTTTLYFGIGFEEIHRLTAIAQNWEPFKVEAPLCWDEFGWADRTAIMQELSRHGLKRPRLYDLGFAHANCGGFCVKAGLAHYRNLLEKLPEVYLEHEEKERQFRQCLGRDDVAILRQTVNGKTQGITLEDWRKHIQSQPVQGDLFTEALGGCNCFTEEIIHEPN
ncbi:hypothetical protein H6G45_06405 [Synechocystis sp. FACHB-383]|uniref:phosphoadenosine phosphosulfate reductase domain-containing protein n=1 Tax=Synechocystis sp. FACHB-383 TaxID=2692864 RepID=UPI00168902AB|nr:phosphoadenosine phosphosulfate reductase family protein [Synechocystis sp. FACHB-383]MBD2653124.1 hypothetical protein [Synechocystis sp. FACHB-383]